jgi:hypothetical protein
MQLGPSKVPPSALAAEWADDADQGSGANAWGNDDLMDVNADEGDWSPLHGGFFRQHLALIIIFMQAFSRVLRPFRNLSPRPPQVRTLTF